LGRTPTVTDGVERFEILQNETGPVILKTMEQGYTVKGDWTMRGLPARSKYTVGETAQYQIAKGCPRRITRFLWA